MRRRDKFLLGGAGLGLLLGALSVEPLVEWRAEAALSDRGISANVEDVSFGWGRIWLHDVALGVPELPTFSAKLHHVSVDFDWLLRKTQVGVFGGSIQLAGSYEKLRDLVRARRSSSGKSSSRAGGTPFTMTGLDLTWVEPRGSQHVWGLKLERSPDGAERVAMDHARLSAGDSTVELRNAELKLKRDSDGARVVDSLGVSSAVFVLEFAELREALALGDEKPAQAKLRKSAGSVNPAAFDKAGRSKPQAPPSTPSKAQPQDAEAGQQLAGFLFTLDPERPKRVQRAIAELRKRASRLLPADAKLDLSGVELELHRANDRLHLGPSRLTVVRKANALSVSWVPGKTNRSATPLALSLSLPLTEKTKSEAEIELRGGPVSLASLGVKEGDFGLQNLEQTEIDAHLKLVFTDAAKALTFSGKGGVRDATLHHSALSNEALRELSVAWRVEGQLALSGSQLRFDKAELAVGKVRTLLSGQILRDAEHIEAKLEGGIPLASCQALLEAVPEGLSPMLSGIQMEGTLALDAGLSFDSRKLRDIGVKWDLDNNCRITQIPPELDPRQFLSVFYREVEGAQGGKARVQSGPGSVGWARYADISPHMETAVLVCEDGRFFRHDGFDDEAIANSIRENIKQGRFVRGASTISMQLAKNLYLSRQKTMARKLQEAVLTLLLEQELSKEEMMELYLNVIEYGPGIYGIGAAASHYFSTTPRQLSLGQALYLASILPNPKVQYFTDQGKVSDRWMNYLRKLMKIALKIKRIDEEQYQQALLEEVAFGVPYEAPDFESLSVDDALLVPLEPTGAPLNQAPRP